MSLENVKNAALKKAVESGKVDEAQMLLFHGADPNYLSKDGERLIQLAMKQYDVDIVKLLVQYEASIEKDQERLAEFVFESKNIHRSKELVAHIFKYTQDTELLEDFFFYLNFSENHQGSMGLEIFKLLLDLGLPTDAFVCTERYDFEDEESDSYTVLHQCIIENRVDFVQELLNRGVEINQKTEQERNCLFTALLFGAVEPMLKLLVEEGVDVNERSIEGATLLHLVCYIDDCAYPHNVHLLCKYGVDPNLLEKYGNTCLMNTEDLSEDRRDDTREAVIEELAKLRFSNEFVCPKNMDFINKSEESREFFDECLQELQKMKDLKFYRDIALYDVVEMSKFNKTKLVCCARNKNFVAAFMSGWDRELFEHYAEYLDDLFDDALEIRDVLLHEEKLMISAFKFHLPDLVTRKIAYFCKEDLFF